MSADLTKIIKFISLIQLKADAMKEIKVVLQRDEPDGAGSVEGRLTCLGFQGLSYSFRLCFSVCNVACTYCLMLLSRCPSAKVWQ